MHFGKSAGNFGGSAGSAAGRAWFGSRNVEIGCTFTELHADCPKLVGKRCSSLQCGYVGSFDLGWRNPKDKRVAGWNNSFTDEMVSLWGMGSLWVWWGFCMSNSRCPAHICPYWLVQCTVLYLNRVLELFVFPEIPVVSNISSLRTKYSK